MKLLDDLRFVIGVFFLLVTVVLVFAGNEPSPAAVDGSLGNLNLFGAGLTGCFGVAMLLMTFLLPIKEHA